MPKNLLINVKYENISTISKNLTYHSGQKRIFLAEKGSYIFFLSFNKSTHKHEMIGYFIFIDKLIDESNHKWGKYTIKGTPGKFIKGKDFSKVLDYLDLKIGHGSKKSKDIGMATETIREINEHDKYVLLGYLDT